MKEWNEENIWYYLDGQLNAEDVQWFEELLNSDKDKMEEFLHHQKLHDELGGLDIILPAEGFTDRVLANLPETQASVSLDIAPLFPKKTLVAFGATCGLFLISILVLLSLLPASTVGTPNQVTLPISSSFDTFFQVWETMPHTLTQGLQIIIFGTIGILLLDMAIRKIMSRRVLS